MKTLRKILLSVAVVAGFFFYAVYQRTQGAAPNAPTPQSNDAATTTAVPNVKANDAAPLKAIPTPQPAPPARRTVGQYADGEYTGSVADAFYGTVQVKAIVRGGKLADVQFLAFPNDRENSQYINSIAVPQLRSEAIAAQNANVDIVSGATATSQAFIESLSSALAAAKI